MTMYFAGLRGTGSFGADERPKSFREMILWMNPNGTAPLFALTSKGKTEPVDDPQFYWWEEMQTICRLQASDNIASNEETITISAGDALELIPGDILQVEPATEVTSYVPELIRVKSVTSATEFEAERGVAGTTAATITKDGWLTRVGNAQSEGNLSVSSSSQNPVKLTNYTQIFKTPYQISKSALATKFRTGDPKKNEQKRKSFQHAEKSDQTPLWGSPYETQDPSNRNMALAYT